MTDLEYMICEAETVGEIDLDTRNNLLNVLYEKSQKEDTVVDLINQYGKKNYYNKIIGIAIHKMRKDISNPNVADEYIDEELNQYKHLIDECNKLKEKAPDKIPMKQILKLSHKAGVKGAVGGTCASLACNAIGLKTDVTKSAVTSAAISSASTAVNNIPKTKASLEDDIKRLTENMNKLKSEYPKHRDAYKNSYNYKRRLKKINKQQEVKEYVDDLYNTLL